MRITSSLSAVCLLATLIGLPGSVSAPPQTGQMQINPGDMNNLQFLPPGRKPKTGTGKLRGKVVANDTGAVIRRAQVRISSSDIGTKTAFTDAQGRYEFSELPAGRFNLSVSKSGFVTMQYGQTRPFEPGHPIELADAQVMEKADIALPRGSAVSGRVLDEFGEPVADANVTAMRTQFMGGHRRLVPSGRASTTNDLGQFRVFGLPPGEYYVSASMRSFDSMILDMMGTAGGPTGSNNNSGYAATYYPGTPNPGEAQRLSLTIGQELSTVDIQMQPVKLARITGVATTSDGKPMSGALVMMMPSIKEALAFMPGGTSRTDKDGNFTLSGVAPGEYSIQIQSMAAMMSVATEAMSMLGGDDAPAGKKAPAPPAEREFVMANVTVTGDDITNLVVTGAEGAKATGHIVFDGGSPPDKIASLRLIAAPTESDNIPAAASMFGSSVVNENGTFEIGSLVGGRTLRIMNLPKGWNFKEVTREGTDVTDKGFDFKPGTTVENFEIVLTTKEQTVTGSVTNDKGETPREYTVVVFAEDRQKWAFDDSRWMRSARPDQQGQFKITDLPAGAYLAVAVDYVAEGEWRDPEWLGKASKNATKFTLDEGGTKRLDLKLGGV
jgi:protocatechuate 3,4-dioxygenase beta subunit